MVCCFAKCKFCLRRKFVVGISLKKMRLIKLVSFKTRLREIECICKKKQPTHFFKAVVIKSHRAGVATRQKYTSALSERPFVSFLLHKSTLNTSAPLTTQAIWLQSCPFPKYSPKLQKTNKQSRVNTRADKVWVLRGLT